MFCKKCGAQLPDGSKFCRKCGAKCVEDAAPAAAGSSAAEPPKQKKKSGKAIWIVVICLVVGIAGCVGAFFLFHSKDQSEDANKAANDSESSIATDAEETAGTSEQDSEKPAKTTSAAKHTDSSEDEEFEKKAASSDDAKAVLDAANTVFESQGVTSTGNYRYGNDAKIDEQLKSKCDFLDDYTNVSIYTLDGKALSVVCYKEEDGTRTYSTAPTSCTDEMLRSGVSTIYLALDAEGKLQANNHEAEKLGEKFDGALRLMQHDGNLIQEGTYTLQNCDDLRDYISTDLTPYEAYQQVEFEVYTTDTGLPQCSLILSVDGEYTGAYPTQTTMSNWSTYTLEDGIEK